MKLIEKTDLPEDVQPTISFAVYTAEGLLKVALIESETDNSLSLRTLDLNPERLKIQRKAALQVCTMKELRAEGFMLTSMNILKSYRLQTKGLLQQVKLIEAMTLRLLEEAVNISESEAY